VVSTGALFPAELRRVQLERGFGTDSSAASVLASERPDWCELAVNDVKNLVAVVEECLASWRRLPWKGTPIEAESGHAEGVGRYLNALAFWTGPYIWRPFTLDWPSAAD
jgi:hypothetical protein